MSSKPRWGGGSFSAVSGNTFEDNLSALQQAFPDYPKGLSWRNAGGHRIAQMECDDPIAAATQFAAIASEGYVSESLLENGYVRELADGTRVTFRLTSSSDGSPAVDLNISSESKIRKIHFVQKEEE